MNATAQKHIADSNSNTGKCKRSFTKKNQTKCQNQGVAALALPQVAMSDETTTSTTVATPNNRTAKTNTVNSQNLGDAIDIVPQKKAPAKKARLKLTGRGTGLTDTTKAKNEVTFDTGDAKEEDKLKKYTPVKE
eukprot:4723617-Ditylum_brightwellii.AAC.1